MATNPHAAGRGGNSWEHEESTEMTSCNLLVVDKQSQCAGFHGDGDLELTSTDFLGANKMRALMSVNDIKVRCAMIEPKSPSALVITECSNDSVFVGWAINDGRHREATKH